MGLGERARRYSQCGVVILSAGWSISCGRSSSGDTGPGAVSSGTSADESSNSTTTLDVSSDDSSGHTRSGGGSDGTGVTTEPERPCVAPNPYPAVELLDDPALRPQQGPSELPVYVFSQSGPSSIDPQLFQVGEAVSIRTTGQWGVDGTRVEDYAADSIEQLRATGTRVILGLTASVVFASQFDVEAEFLDVVSRDASNQPVRHVEIVPDAYRGNMANPRFRDLIVQNAKTLIDVGADGVFFDEANSGHGGAAFDGNEGFDDYHEADFRTFLCAKHPDWTSAGFTTQFGVGAENALDCGAPNCVGTGFSARRYMQDAGLSISGLADSPLMSEWGTSIGNRLNPTPTSFLQTYEAGYWANVVSRVRQYARDTYQKEILVTSNGLFPFVDFQSVGLYPWNADGPDGSVTDYVQYVPTTSDGRLDARVSLLDGFTRLREHSRALAGDVPVVLFVDWPTDMMSAYYDFSLQEKQDYFRIYGAEAYAAGLRFAWHLKTSMPDDPTAEDSGMLDWFTAEAEFYRRNAALYAGAQPSDVTASTTATDVSLATTQLADGRLVVHVINHAYAAGLTPQAGVQVSVNTVATELAATAVSPETADDVSVALMVDANVTTFELPMFSSYVAVAIR